MRFFTIENETNNITLHATLQSAEAVANAETFRSESGLHKLATDWPAARLVEIWNSLPGVSPVKKFKDRQTAVSRIWKALQSLSQVAPAPDEQSSVAEPAPIPDAVQEVSGMNAPEAATATPPVAPQTPDVATEEAPATKKATVRKGATKSQESAKVPRESKTAQVVAMLQRTEGATLREIMSSMGWQKHTVRGFVSILGSKGGEKIESSKNAVGERTYSIAR
jgi:hypothetical protein